jgi:hypothetical protein
MAGGSWSASQLSAKPELSWQLGCSAAVPRKAGSEGLRYERGANHRLKERTQERPNERYLAGRSRFGCDTEVPSISTTITVAMGS